MSSLRSRALRNGAHIPLFNFKYGGFFFNEGGRGLTLGIMPGKFCPFRLYIAGWVLMYSLHLGKYACYTPAWKFWVHYHWTLRGPKTR